MLAACTDNAAPSSSAGADGPIRVTSTGDACKVSTASAKSGNLTFAGYEHVFFDVMVERMEPQALLSYRWHPYNLDPAVDYEKEAPTLVTFTLKDAPGKGTVLTVLETGFDNIPPGRRLEAFRMNSAGWKSQMDKLVRHVTA